MRKKRRLRDEPASFWIGAGLVAEAPLMLSAGFLSGPVCKDSAALHFLCPPPLWPLLCGLVVWFLLVAWVGNRLGLGAAA
jgi:hypothetical protein